ncbi:MAG: hypothetical protein NC238_09045 [Dehalobacter sp.]|nr:hypothetical protein [Dehalobacter sp.]
MSPPEFEDLPFFERPDLTPYLIHLTKNTVKEDEYSAFENLVNILKGGEIWGSDKTRGFIKGPNTATCFMDVPFISLKYILNEDNCDPNDPRYEPYGIFVSKKLAYKKNCRPVLYLSDDEMKTLGIPEEEKWRVVKFEVSKKGWISWIHEREWRCKGSFELPEEVNVLVKSIKDCRKLQRRVLKNPDSFKTKPKIILPLNVVCQGLNYL